MLLLSILVFSFLTVSAFALQLRKFDYHSRNFACQASNSRAEWHMRNLMSGKSLRYLESVGEESLFLIQQFGPQSVYRKDYLEQIYDDAPQELNEVMVESLLRLHRIIQSPSDIDASIIQQFTCQEFGMSLSLEISKEIILTFRKVSEEFRLPVITGKLNNRSLDQKSHLRSLHKRQHDELNREIKRAFVGLVQIIIGVHIARTEMIAEIASEGRRPFFTQELIQAAGHVASGYFLIQQEPQQALIVFSLAAILSIVVHVLTTRHVQAIR
ncbi:hypothetical protein MP228_011699 [Amoeboaphelidium protococcarum]|nr:hypothetical protein MP228_011699 [Amoeboaphelidium protococcarum]